MATTSTLGAQERRSWLLTALQQEGAIRLDPAAEQLGVSSMTVRRDLDELEAEGLLRRVRGGAVPALGPRPFNERRASNARAKHIIAEKAVALMPTEGAVAFDASTTAGTVGSALGERRGLTAVTNSYENFSSLASGQGVTGILVGGEREPATGSFVGLIACEAAASMLYKKFFTSASAVDARHGTSEVSLQESQVKRAFGGVSQEVILCVDSSKLDGQAVALGFPLGEISLMITELDPRNPQLDLYRNLVELR